METTMEAPAAWLPIPFPARATVRELYMPAMTIIDPDEAQVYLDALVARMVNHFDHTPTQAIEIARTNLLAVAESFGDEVLSRVGRLFTEAPIQLPATLEQSTLFDLPDPDPVPPALAGESYTVSVWMPMYRTFEFTFTPRTPLPPDYSCWKAWGAYNWPEFTRELGEGEIGEIVVEEENDHPSTVCDGFMHVSDEWEEAGEPEVEVKDANETPPWMNLDTN